MVDLQGPGYRLATRCKVGKETITKANVEKYVAGLNVNQRNLDAHPERCRPRLLSEALQLEAVYYESWGAGTHAALGLKLLLAAWGKDEAKKQLNTLRGRQGRRGYSWIDESQLARFYWFFR